MALQPLFISGWEQLSAYKGKSTSPEKLSVQSVFKNQTHQGIKVPIRGH